MEKKIFISHASADAEIVDLFVDNILLAGLGFKHQEIFFTSAPGMGIGSGEDWRNSIKHKLLSVKVVFLIITPNYKSSEICLNEMGAAWVTCDNVIPMIIEPINYVTVGVLAEVKQVEKFNSDAGMDNVCDKMLEIFNDIEKPALAKWSSQKKKFLLQAKDYLCINKFPELVSKEALLKLQNEIKELSEENENLIAENIKNEKYIKVLESKKDATAISESKKAVGLYNGEQELENLVDNIKNDMDFCSRALSTFIFNSYTGNNLYVEYHYYKSEIDEAIAKEYINEDNEVLWDFTKEMEELRDSLDTLDEFIDKLDSNSYCVLENKYGRLSMKNMKFWENILGVKFAK